MLRKRNDQENDVPPSGIDPALLKPIIRKDEPEKLGVLPKIWYWWEGKNDNLPPKE